MHPSPRALRWVNGHRSRRGYHRHQASGGYGDGTALGSHNRSQGFQPCRRGRATPPSTPRNRTGRQFCCPCPWGSQDETHHLFPRAPSTPPFASTRRGTVLGATIRARVGPACRARALLCRAAIRPRSVPKRNPGGPTCPASARPSASPRSWAAQSNHLAANPGSSLASPWRWSCRNSAAFVMSLSAALSIRRLLFSSCLAVLSLRPEPWAC